MSDHDIALLMRDNAIPPLGKPEFLQDIAAISITIYYLHLRSTIQIRTAA
jgi:hypothetical protein